MRHVWLTLLAVVVGALVLPAFVFLTPLSLDLKVKVGLYIMVSLLHVGVAAMYLLGLKGFKHQFKVGYWYMSAAMFAYSLGILGLPLFDVIKGNLPGTSESTSTIVLQYLVIFGPFFLFLLLYYLGARKLAKIIGIKSKALSVAGVLVAVLVLGVLASQLPVPEGAFDSDINDSAQHVMLAASAAVFVVVMATLILLFHLMRNSGVLYRRAFTWNFYGFLAFFAIQLFDPSSFLPADHWYAQYGTTIPFLLGAVCFMKAAVEFGRIPVAERLLQTNSAQGLNGSTRKTSIDIVVTLAQLASNPRVLDPELDSLRALTSSLRPGEALKEAQQVKVANIYKDIEDYLVHREQARRYASEDLRQLVEIQYRGSVDEPVFWKALHTPAA
jgi:hypothetical protein